MRTIYITAALAASISAAYLVAACDKSGAEVQATADQAQDKANADIAKATDEANAKARAAQAVADQKVNAVSADFVKTREDYRHQVQSNLDSANKTIADLESKERTALGKAKADLDAILPALRAQRDAFAADLRSIDAASAVTWDSTKARLDKEWADLKVAVDKAT